MLSYLSNLDFITLMICCRSVPSLGQSYPILPLHLLMKYQASITDKEPTTILARVDSR